jgi:hypothetical protein
MDDKQTGAILEKWKEWYFSLTNGETYGEVEAAIAADADQRLRDYLSAFLLEFATFAQEEMLPNFSIEFTSGNYSDGYEPSGPDLHFELFYDDSPDVIPLKRLIDESIDCLDECRADDPMLACYEAFANFLVTEGQRINERISSIKGVTNE